MTMTDPNDKLLDDLFATARDAAPAASDALMARVLADATVAQQARRPAAEPQKGLWQSLLDMLGGWPTLGGLAVAGVTGVWIGVAPPMALETLAAEVVGNTATVSFGTDITTFEEIANGDG